MPTRPGFLSNIGPFERNYRAAREVNRHNVVKIGVLE
jgi:hypothetical protein